MNHQKKKTMAPKRAFFYLTSFFIGCIVLVGFVYNLRGNMPHEIDPLETREQRIEKFLLAEINKNTLGILIEDLWEKMRQEPSFKDDNLTTQDVGPALGILSEKKLVEGDGWYYKEGERVIFKPIVNPTWVDRALCMFLGHAPPDNSAFESMGALFVGGICTRCGKLSQGKFLGNVLTPAFERGLRVCRIP